MVAPGEKGISLALDVSQGSIQEYQALGAAVITYPFEAVLDWIGEPSSQRFLVALQNVHHEFIRGHDQLVEVLPRGRLTQGTHLLIIHGRRTCVARKPACPKCSIRALCPWPGKTRS